MDVMDVMDKKKRHDSGSEYCPFRPSSPLRPFLTLFRIFSPFQELRRTLAGFLYKTYLHTIQSYTLQSHSIMATITLKGNSINTAGQLPAVGSELPSFTLVKSDLSEASLSDFAGKKLVLNVFPSLDTAICATSVRRFNQEAAALGDTVVLCISADLPFAQSRFCVAEGLERVVPLSVFRSPEFGQSYGLVITDGPLKGLLSRAVIVADETGKVLYSEQVPEIVQEPDYTKALAALA